MNTILLILMTQAGGPGPSLAEMAPLYAAISVLAPSAAEGRLPDDAATREAIAQLATHAKRLERHVGKDDLSARAIARALSRSARFAHARYVHGDHQVAARIVRSVTASCAACHLRHPRADKLFSKGIVDAPAVAKLSPVAQARLFAATRQTEAALAALEKSELYSVEAAWLHTEISVRGRGDIPRAVRFLSRAQQPRRVSRWRAVLRATAVPKSVAAAEALVAQGVGEGARVSALVAARGLDVQLTRGSARERALAHLLLARAELTLGDLPATTALLEAALALDPDGPTAEAALELLYEAYVRLAAPDPLPDDLLRALDAY